MLNDHLLNAGATEMEDDKSCRIDPSSDTTLQLPVIPQSGAPTASLLKLGFASVEIIEITGYLG